MAEGVVDWKEILTEPKVGKRDKSVFELWGY